MPVLALVVSKDLCGWESSLIFLVVVDDDGAICIPFS